MSKQLDHILDNYINKKSNEELGLEEDSECQRILDAAKEQIKTTIYDEITAEVRDKALREAEVLIEQKANMRKLNEYKKLAVEGFMLAFIVGLLVNQITDIIGFYKGSLDIESIGSTIWISLVLMLICVCIFIYIFLKTLINLWKEVKKHASD